ncbi:hypothetical protein BC937DRAFT_88044 [Endogone sp. FLAS-F59071]|nr:hypothetical protein BC937DRAFT_88044 [Endogone sp. FLAS-F59071]|eukprot:RUS19046.1 hypothetical protein BC937DRAFT_88044 [Endogone sp. FLAS-F59071]
MAYRGRANSRDCPTGEGSSGPECYKCGKPGHIVCRVVFSLLYFYFYFLIPSNRHSDILCYRSPISILWLIRFSLPIPLRIQSRNCTSQGGFGEGFGGGSRGYGGGGGGGSRGGYGERTPEHRIVNIVKYSTPLVR